VGRGAPECWTQSQDLFTCDWDHKFSNKVSRQFTFMCYCYTHCEFSGECCHLICKLLSS
jgi:hypothetical protein